MTPSTIVVGTDFSDAARSALGVAIRLARRWKADVRIIHGIGVESSLLASVFLESDTREALLASSRAKLDELIESIDTVEVAVSGDVIAIPADQALAAAAEDPAVRLVVVGSRGMTRLDRLILGSVAQKTARYAPTSVLVVKQPNPTLSKVVIGSDLSACSEAAIRLGCDVSAPGADIEVVSAIEPSPFIDDAPDNAPLEQLRVELEQQVARAVGDNPPLPVHCEVGAPERVLVARADKREADLIVVGSHGRRGLSRWLLGSTAERLINSPSPSVLLAREERTPA